MNISSVTRGNGEHRKRCKRRHNDGLKKTKTAGNDMGDGSVNEDYTAVFQADDISVNTVIVYTAVA